MGIRRYAPIIPVMALFILYMILWWIAVIGISRAMVLPIDERWAGSSMLALQGGIALSLGRMGAGCAVAAVFAAVVLPLAFLAEYVGVRTGYPFGAYSYNGHARAPAARCRARADLPRVADDRGRLARSGALIRAAWLILAYCCALSGTCYGARCSDGADRRAYQAVLDVARGWSVLRHPAIELRGLAGRRIRDQLLRRVGLVAG